jgi:hypothetical protein
MASSLRCWRRRLGSVTDVDKMCGNCGDAVTFDASDGTWVGSDGEVTCPESDRPHGPVVADEEGN